MTNRILLLGAGFSRNWGGWLASEAFEYLLGCRQVDDSLRTLLLLHKTKGFEAALETLQGEQSRGSSDIRLTNLEAALRDMFEAMNRAYQRTTFNFSGRDEQSVTQFLTRFDAIFTLNQDCLLEIHYLNDSLASKSNGRWDGWTVPGMSPIGEPNWALPAFRKWKSTGTAPHIESRCQPYIKLHGSSEWESDTDNLLIMGGNKSAAIKRNPVLAWGMNTFEHYLSRPQTRLMIVGYSFRDDHINSLLTQATAKNAISMFVVDPEGMDVMNANRHGGLIDSPTSMATRELWPFVRGCSRRPLSSTFGADRAEHANLMRFIA